MSRYAIYATFPPGPFGDALSAWLGWDSLTGQDKPHPDLPLPVAEITKRPRKYGAHGTIKAPFRLASGRTDTELRAALRAFCLGQPPVSLPGLEIARLGRFLALVPAAPCPALDALAAATVAGLDEFRAPPDEADLARRRNARLTPRQDANLTRWGYPHVMEDFRFHITLTGPLKPDIVPDVQAALTDYLRQFLEQPMRIDALSLMGEDARTGHFHVLEREPLGQ
ncbi:DUF1045 domain-containing protein [Primorskyibacter aestuariivivens]|uniref:DUF1045 domain-containing protein n=1 Tax=Primorskyibacter aestuariivivens TaxID=1888912 RepID=UPI0038CD8546